MSSEPCPHCGQPVRAETRVCPYCLTLVNDSVEPASEWYELPPFRPRPAAFAMSVLIAIAIAALGSRDASRARLAWMLLPLPALWLGRGDLRRVLPALAVSLLAIPTYFVIVLVLAALGFYFGAVLGGSELGSALAALGFLAAGLLLGFTLATRITRHPMTPLPVVVVDWIAWSIVFATTIYTMFELRI